MKKQQKFEKLKLKITEYNNESSTLDFKTVHDNVVVLLKLIVVLTQRTSNK